jgi:hypothetical protein
MVAGMFFGGLVAGLVVQGVRVLRGGEADWWEVVFLAVGFGLGGLVLSLWIRWADQTTKP